MSILRQNTVAKMVSILQRAIADLELRIPRNAEQVYGPGAVYDFYRALKEIMESAQSTVFVIDPYLDEEVFHTYIAHLARNVTVRMLLMQFAAQVRGAIEKFALQHRIHIEARSSELLHDRVIFIDDNSCWVLGQSIKDAAKKKPTYIAPLSADAAGLKLIHYEGIWSKGEILYATTKRCSESPIKPALAELYVGTYLREERKWQVIVPQTHPCRMTQHSRI